MTVTENGCVRAVESQFPDPHRVGDLGRLLGRHKGLMLACLVASLAIGAAYLKYVSPVYEVYSQLMVELENLPLDQTQTRFQYDQAFLATQAQIMSSPAVVQPVAYSTNLRWKDLGSSNPMETILNNFSVRPIHGTNVIDLSFRHSNGQLALDVVDELIASYRDHLRESQFHSHMEMHSQLTRNEKELREELDSLEAKYRELRTLGSTMGHGKEASGVQSSLMAGLGAMVNAAKNRRIGLENRLQAMGDWHDSRLAGIKPSHPVSVKLPSLPQAHSNEQFPGNTAGAQVTPRPVEVDETITMIPKRDGLPDLEAIQLALFQARVREKDLGQTYGDKHVLIQAAREEITAWESMIRLQVDAMPALIASELEAARLDELRFTELYQAELEKVKQLDQQLIEEQQAFAAIERVQSIHDSILTQLRQLRLQNEAVADGRSGVKVTVLAAPVLGEKPVWPSPVMVFGTCSAIGLIGGFRLAAGRERTRRQTREL